LFIGILILWDQKKRSDQGCFIPGTQGWFYINKFVNVMQHITRNKDKNHMIISIGAEKAFEKNQHPFMIKALKKLGIEGMFLHISLSLSLSLSIYIYIYICIYICQTYSKQYTRWRTTNTIHTEVTSNASMPLSSLLFNIVLEFLAKAIRKEQELKGIQLGKEEFKPLLFADDMILYLMDLTNSTKNT
jgi:hypothetical protein